MHACGAAMQPLHEPSSGVVPGEGKACSPAAACVTHGKRVQEMRKELFVQPMPAKEEESMDRQGFVRDRVVDAPCARQRHACSGRTPLRPAPCAAPVQLRWRAVAGRHDHTALSKQGLEQALERHSREGVGDLQASNSASGRVSGTAAAGRRAALRTTEVATLQRGVAGSSNTEFPAAHS